MIKEIVKLTPAVFDNLWGGVRLKEKYGKVTDLTPLAEAWELAMHKDGKCRIPDGRTLEEAAEPQDLGKNVLDFPYFPTLIKFIDAKKDLSVQVHPSDSYALENESSFGKTEMWYIVEAEEGAGIYLGLNEQISLSELEQAIAENRLQELLRFYPVRAGECYFIPSGTIHAIGAGCLILEIQQNSNLTYRVYDWGRVDKNGKPRELHVEKAKKVSKLTVYDNSGLHFASNEGEILGISKYFTVKKITVDGSVKLSSDEGSFRCFSCVGGFGEILPGGKSIEMSAGDSFFVPALGENRVGEFEIKGKAVIVMTEIRKYYVGIDLGGTFIKGGIVNDLGEIIYSTKVPTECEKGDAGVAANISALVGILLKETGLEASDVVGIGMGVPGMIDSENGVVTYSNNLGWRDFHIGKTVESLTGIPVRIANDANVAALGEARFGGGRGFSDAVMLTLGTGVGGGIIIGGRLFEGNKGAGAELGHSVIKLGGEQCSCGRRGCLEAYASATALIRDTKRAMENNPASAMWDKVGGDIERVDGATAFAVKDTDPTAASVVDSYITSLGEGLVNIANVFRPEVILLGGGVSAEGDNLVKPLEEFMEKNIYAGDKGPGVAIRIATLGNRAGTVGAAALWM